MKIFRQKLIFPLILMLLLFATCQKENPLAVSSHKGNAPVNFKINLAESAKKFLGGQSSKQNINYVAVSISGENLSEPKYLALTISNNQATGTVNLPFGLTDFYVVASVRDELIDIPLFSGMNTVDITRSVNSVTINLLPMIENEVYFYWHDGSFESSYYASNQGDLILAYFIPSEPIFITGVSLQLFWQGNSGDYRIIVKDEFLANRFRSGNPLPPEADGWVSWDLIWGADPAVGIFDAGFYVGFEYDSNSAWPEIGYDMTNPSGSSKFYDSAQDMWYYMSDGDFAITVTVQSQSGKEYQLKPVHIVDHSEKAMSRGKALNITGH